MQKRICLFLLGFWLTFTANADQNQQLKQAWEAITNQQYNEAIVLLEKQIDLNPSDFDAKYLLSKAYAWNKQTEEGIRILDTLISRFPTNTDYLLSKATFLSWQNQSQLAINILVMARSITPNYQDIWKTELTIRKRQLTDETRREYSQVASEYEFRFGDTSFALPSNTNITLVSSEILGFGAGLDKLNNGSQDWHDFFINYTRYNKKRAYSMQADFVNRFGISDQQLSMQYILNNFYKFQLTSQISIGIEDKLLPTWKAALQINKITSKSGNVELFYGHNRYSSLNTDTVRAAYSHSWKKVEPKLHAIATIFNNNEYTTGILLQTTYYHDDNTLFRISASENTEVEYSTTGQTPYLVRALSLDGRTKLSKNWDIDLAVTHHIQGKAYDKNGIHTGLRYRF